MGQAAKTTNRRKKPVHLTPALSPARRGSEPGNEAPIPVSEQYLDPKGVGKRLKLSPRTVADMANEGRLDADEDGIGGDDAADALRYLVATKNRTITQRQLRGF
jgi:hypothetical protein